MAQNGGQIKLNQQIKVIFIDILEKIIKQTAQLLREISKPMDFGGVVQRSHKMNKKLNICLFTSSFLPKVGGRELVVHNLATALSNIGHNVIVFVPFSKDRKKQKSFNYKIVQFGFRGYGKLKLIIHSMIVTLAYIVLVNKIDVINVHSVYKPGTWVYIFSKLFKKMPIVGTPHGDDIQVFPHINYGVRLNPENDKIVQCNIKSFSRVTAISKSIRSILEEMLEDDQYIRDIPNGVWTSIFQKKNANDKIEIRKKYDIPLNSNLLISVGRNHPIKGFEISVEVLSELRNKGYDISYMLIGRDMAPIRKKAQSLGVSDWLFTPGQLEIEEVANLFQASDIYISSSLMESFGLTTIEAMSAGLPCVVSDVEGSRDIVSSKFGIFTEPENAQELADAIQHLLENHMLLKNMGVEAQHEAQKYDWPIIAKMYEDVYKEAIMEKKRTSVI